LAYKLGVIIAAGFGPVAASHEEEATDCAGFHRFHHPVRDGEHGSVTESSRNFRAAVDAGKGMVLRVSAQFQRFLDHGREVLVFPDVDEAGVGDDLRRVHAVPVGGLHGHKAVGREKHRSGDMVEFLLLVLPGGTEVPLEVRVFLQARIGVRGQHLPVGIDVNALALGLAQQEFQILQIVAADDDEGPFFDQERYCRRDGRSICLRVGLIQQLHAAIIDLAHFEDHGQ